VTVRQIIKTWLKKHGYAGLCNADIQCGCGLNDLFRCEDPSDRCEPAYLCKLGDHEICKACERDPDGDEWFCTNPKARGPKAVPAKGAKDRRWDSLSLEESARPTLAQVGSTAGSVCPMRHSAWPTRNGRPAPQEGVVKAISLYQPWAWLLRHGHEHPNGKRVENRSWPLPPSMVGKWCLIHASKNPGSATHMSKELWRELLAADRICTQTRIIGLEPVDQVHIPPACELDFGGIIGVVKWGTPVHGIEGTPSASAEIVAVLNSAWFCGPWGWPTLDAKPLPFVPWRGGPGFFNVPLAELPAEYQWLKEAK